MTDPTPLEMIYDQLKELSEKMDRVITCQIDLKLQDEVLKGKISAIELQQIKIQTDLEEHKKDLKQHFNPFYDETIPEKLWRKKTEIGAGVSLATLITFVLKFFGIV